MFQLKSTWKIFTISLIILKWYTRMLFSKYLVGDAASLFRNLEAGSIGSWDELCNTFSRCWGENMSFDKYLIDFHTLRRGEEEALVVFNRRFYSVYYSLGDHAH